MAFSKGKQLPPFRPVDAIFPGRREAIAEEKCMKTPLGCGKPAESFRDGASRKEYAISGLCQKCQDKLFPPSN